MPLPAGLVVLSRDGCHLCEQMLLELAALERAGATDVLLYPASGGLEQVGLLAEALRQAGFVPAGNP
jgi:hypothetical protein